MPKAKKKTKGVVVNQEEHSDSGTRTREARERKDTKRYSPGEYQTPTKPRGRGKKQQVSNTEEEENGEYTPSKPSKPRSRGKKQNQQVSTTEEEENGDYTPSKPRRSPRKQVTPKRAHSTPKRTKKKGGRESESDSTDSDIPLSQNKRDRKQKTKEQTGNCDNYDKGPTEDNSEVVELRTAGGSQDPPLPPPAPPPDPPKKQTGKKDSKSYLFEQSHEDDLAEMIGMYPILWNPVHPDHDNRDKVNQTWQHIANSFRCPGKYNV